MQLIFFFFSSRRRHTRFDCDWSSDVCSSDLSKRRRDCSPGLNQCWTKICAALTSPEPAPSSAGGFLRPRDRKSTRLNSSHSQISYAVFCLKKKKKNTMSSEHHYA